jgi:hypothetical protein
MVAANNEIAERVEITAKDGHPVGFTFNRHGWAAVKHLLQTPTMTICGIPFAIVDEQKERVRAWWDYRSLTAYLKRG